MIAGIDYSLNSPCVCTMMNGKMLFGVSNKNGKHAKHYSHIKKIFESVGDCLIEYHLGEFHTSHLMKEYATKAMAISHFLSLPAITKVYIEDYAYSRNNSSSTPLIEATGILKCALQAQGIEYQTVSIQTIKKFATGKGNATKDMMYEAWVKDTGIELPNPGKSPSADIVDAYYIYKLGESLEKAKDITKE